MLQPVSYKNSNKYFGSFNTSRSSAQQSSTGKSEDSEQELKFTSGFINTPKQDNEVI